MTEDTTTTDAPTPPATPELDPAKYDEPVEPGAAAAINVPQDTDDDEPGLTEEDPGVEAGIPTAQPPDGAFKLDLDIENLDPDVVEQIDAMNKFYAGELDQVRQQLDQRAASSNEAELDAFVNSLGASYTNVFGKGPTASLDTRGSAYAARARLWETREVLIEGHKKWGNAPSPTELFKRALGSAFADKAMVIARAELNNKVKARQSQLQHRPTSRGGKELTPVQAATAAIARKLESLGVDEEDGRFIE